MVSQETLLRLIEVKRQLKLLAEEEETIKSSLLEEDFEKEVIE